MQKQKILIVHNYYQVPGGEDAVAANEKYMLEMYGHKYEGFQVSIAEAFSAGTPVICSSIGNAGGLVSEIILNIYK